MLISVGVPGLVAYYHLFKKPKGRGRKTSDVLFQVLKFKRDANLSSFIALKKNHKLHVYVNHRKGLEGHPGAQDSELSVPSSHFLLRIAR